MKLSRSTLVIWVVALWWGGLTAVGFGVVPMLFVHLPTPAMAGAMAAKLFSALTWLTVICGLFLLLLSKQNQVEAHEKTEDCALIFIVFGMLLALLEEFTVAPRIIARQDLPLWHSIGSTMYVLQWFCASATLKRCVAGRSRLE